MNLIEFVPPRPHRLWALCRQMGISDVAVKVAPELTGRPEVRGRGQKRSFSATFPLCVGSITNLSCGEMGRQFPAPC